MECEDDPSEAQETQPVVEEEPEQEESDEEEDGDLESREIDVEGSSAKLIVVKLPEVRLRRINWVFTRSLEHLVWNTDSNASNLLHTLEKLRIHGCVRLLRGGKQSTLASHGVTPEQFKTLMGLFHKWTRQLDPMASLKARECSLIPVDNAAVVALHVATKTSSVHRQLAAVRVLKALCAAPTRRLFDSRQILSATPRA